MRFRLALASAAGSDWTSDGDVTHACKHAKFQAMRDLAYSLFDVPHVPVRAQERIVMAVVVKSERDKRRMLLGADVARVVQEKWPQVRLRPEPL